MHVGTSFKCFGGAVAIYVIMAACSSAPADTSYLNPPHGDGGGGADSANGSSGGLLDALTDPVPDAKADPNTSGSRLKARRYVGEDGASQFIGWFDSQRAEICNFVDFLDGVLRCVPVWNGGSTDVFSDPGCTAPVKLAQIVHDCAKPKYTLATTVANPSCGSPQRYEIHEVGTPTTTAFIKAGTSCVSAVNPTYDFYALGAAIPATSFVSAKVTTD